MKKYIKQYIKIKFINLKEAMETILCTDLITFEEKKKYAFLFLSADYNNLGDIAITLSQFLFLKNQLKNYEVICVKPSDTIKYCKSIKKLSRDDVIVTIIGGGNNGSLYEFLERPRRYILRSLKKYKIISFPQTVMFESTERAIPYEKEFIKVVNKCSDISLFAREQYSFRKYKEMKFKQTNICICPDIVFSLKPPRINDQNGSGIAIMLRDDIEKSVSEKYQSCIIDYLRQSVSDDLEIMDTWGNANQNFDDKSLEKFLLKLSHKRIAITDRLHGMIFCYITQTPCIVIDSDNPKIISTYMTWLQSCNYIKICKTNGPMKDFIRTFRDLLYHHNKLKESKQIEYHQLLQICKGDKYETNKKIF